jgi:acyl-CoA reductase-like NAD-dependent aldehyde dehydrogenase
MFINGDGRRIHRRDDPVINPATEEVIAEVPKGSESRTSIAAVAAARAAFGEWSQTTPGERSKMLWDWAAKIESAKPELSKLESANVGKPKPVPQPTPISGVPVPVTP